MTKTSARYNEWYGGLANVAQEDTNVFKFKIDAILHKQLPSSVEQVLAYLKFGEIGAVIAASPSRHTLFHRHDVASHEPLQF